jgi:hypothetical protein
MATEKHLGIFNVENLEVEQELKLVGDLTLTGGGTITGDTTITGITTLSDDLVRHTHTFTAATATAFTYEYPDEGVIFLDGSAGACLGHLPTPTAGKVVTFIYTGSGSVIDIKGSGCISGCFCLSTIPGGTGTYNRGAWAVLKEKGATLTVAGYNGIWYNLNSGSGWVSWEIG